MFNKENIKISERCTKEMSLYDEGFLTLNT